MFTKRYPPGIAVMLFIILCSSSAQAQTVKTTITLGQPPSGTSGWTFFVNAPGVIYHITVAVVLSHDIPQDIDLLLTVGDRGVLWMSDVEESVEPWFQRRVVFDDCAHRTLDKATLPTGAYRPTNIGQGDTFPVSYTLLNTLSGFNGRFASPAAWQLYLWDDTDNGISGILHSAEITVFTEPVSGSTGNAVSCPQPDYDGDGRTDVSIYRPETGEWFVKKSGENGALMHRSWGAPDSGDLAGTGRLRRRWHYGLRGVPGGGRRMVDSAVVRRQRHSPGLGSAVAPRVDG